MARPKRTKDRTGLLIAAILHVVLIAGLAYWAYRSGKFELLRQAVLQYVRPEKKEAPKPEPVQTKAPSAPLPPINQGMPPPPGSGTRRAVAAEAPSAAGESFFQDTRQQVQGPGGGAGIQATNAPPTPITKAPAPTRAPAPSAFSREATKPSSVASVNEAREKSASAQDAVSNEQISRSGASDAAGAISKVTGASVIDGAFVVVRGLSDRYNSTTLNGGEVPTADPYRKAAQLDLFPSAMIDRVVVTKTFMPDMPAGFAGGAVDIVTKSFPDAFIFNFGLGAEYNTAATGNPKFQTYQGGSTDWMGFDDGTRAIPHSVAHIRNPEDIPQPPGRGPRADADAYTALLGSFNSQMGPVEKAPPWNSSLGFAMGDTFRFLGNRLGLLGTFNYEHKYLYLAGESGRYVPEATSSNTIVPTVNKFYTNDTRSIDAVVWSAGANAAYELNEDNILNFNFFWAQNGSDQVRTRIGTVKLEQINGAENSQGYLNEMRYIERQVHGFQFRGQHTLPEVRDLQANWLASFVNTTQDEPDLRIFNFIGFADGTIDFGGSTGVPEPGYPTHYWRSLNQDNQTYKVDLLLPLLEAAETKLDLKFGGYFAHSERQFSEVTYNFQRTSPNPETGDPNTYPNEFMTGTNLDYTTTTNRRGEISYSWRRKLASDLGNSKYTGEESIYAGYLMEDWQINSALRLTGGGRYETTYLRVDSTARNLGTNVFTSLIDQNDLLPAVALTWTIEPRLQLRAAYGQTVARPTYREIAAYGSYDITGDEYVVGNTNLVMSAIDNYDLRLEWFPRAGDVFALGGFYKHITNPIEKISLDREGNTITYINFPEGKVYGLELEARTRLDRFSPELSNFSLGLNFALIKSEVNNPPDIASQKKDATGFDSTTRPLFDQSPYVLNADLTYDLPRFGSRASLVFQQAGERLYLVNPTGYDVYEQPAPILDFVFTQQIFKNFTFRFTAKNLLNPVFERIYGKSGQLPQDLPYNSFTKGRTFGISLTASF